MGTATARAPGQAGSRLSRAATRRCAFADSRWLSREEMIAAPVRWPRPSRLLAPLQVPAQKMGDALEALGLSTVGELLEHLPRASREARTVAELTPGEQATVAVEVRAISTRAVRRRGMRPLVEATVFDATRACARRSSTSPGWSSATAPGTCLLLHGSADGKGGFRVSHHAIAIRSAAGRAPVPHYGASEGVSSTQILTLVQGARGALHDVAEALPAATRCAEALPDRACALAAMHFPRDPADLDAGEGGWRSRSCC